MGKLALVNPYSVQNLERKARKRTKAMMNKRKKMDRQNPLAYWGGWVGIVFFGLLGLVSIIQYARVGNLNNPLLYSMVWGFWFPVYVAKGYMLHFGPRSPAALAFAAVSWLVGLFAVAFAGYFVFDANIVYALVAIPFVVVFAAFIGAYCKYHVAYSHGYDV